MLPFDQVFAKLVGHWDLHKIISNGSSYQGQAQFTQQANDVLLLEETGILILDDALEVQGERRWIWEFSSDSSVNIYFDEPKRRLYHALVFSWQDEAWSASAQHLCSPDVYDGQYEIAENKMTFNQVVKGPAKDYRMISNFERI